MIMKYESDFMVGIMDKGERPEIVKTRLKRWAQVVACSLRHSSN